MPGEPAQIKRFIERWRADAAFRERARTAPELQSFRPLWAGGEEPPQVARYREHQHAQAQRRRALRRQAEPSHPSFRAWRARQIRRCNSELDGGTADQIIHHPAAFELSRGCSMGCWFCALAPPPLETVWPYTPATRKLWREVLGVLLATLGPAAAQSVCYWATDPLDNPDYERFIADFHEMTGSFPPTTTALADRDLERTRRLLNQGGIHRFSVLSVGQLARLHKAFTPEELLPVELVIQTRDTNLKRARAGRVRSGKLEEAPGSTIACVSGLLFNMPLQTVRLITPCAATREWPLGYRVLSEETFQHASHLQDLLHELLALPVRLGLKEVVRFRGDLKYQACKGGFSLRSPHRVHRFSQDRYPWMKALGEAVLARGDGTTEQLALTMESAGAPLDQTLAVLNLLFEEGLLRAS